MTLSFSAQEGMIQGLEEVLLANPEDVHTHRAYARLLIQHPEPACAARGRLIEAQLKLEDPRCPAAERTKAERRVRKLTKNHGRAWLGPLAPFLLDGQGLDGKAYRFDFARGWLSAINAPVLDPTFLQTLVQAPQASLLRALMIGKLAPGEVPALAPLLQASFLSRLRIFRLGGTAELTERESGEAEILRDLIAHMICLEELGTPWQQSSGAGIAG